jgi:hypothetical protein
MLVAAKTIAFENEAKRKQAEEAVFGRELQKEEYAQFAGVCLPEVNVTVVFYPEAYNGYPIQLKAKSEQKGVFSTMFLLQEGTVVFESASVEEAQRGAGKAWEAFYHIARKAAALGFTTIKGKALRYPAGSPQGKHDGYRAVVRWGFNCELPAGVKEKLEAGLKEATCLHDLAPSEAGRAFWKEHGVTVDVVFDLATDSKCWEILGTPPAAQAPAGNPNPA